MATQQPHGIRLELRHEAFDRAVARLRNVVDDLTDPGREIAHILGDSVRQNFREGGRPDAWPPSGRVRKHGGQTLRDTSNLYNKITAEFDAANGRVVVGTDVFYAPYLHFGVDKTVVQQVRAHTRRNGVQVRAHERRIHMRLPARPFMMIQDEDWETIGDIVQAAIEEAMGE